MTDATTTNKQRWRAFGWSWLDESESNGATRVLVALAGPLSPHDAVAMPGASPGPPPPLAARLVLLWLELVGVVGAALLLLQVAWVAGTTTSSAWRVALPSSDGQVVARASEGAVTALGLLSLAGWLLCRPRRSLALKLLAPRRVRLPLLLLYVMVHAAALSLMPRARLLSATDASTDYARLLTTLIVAPLTEELFFRGLALQLVLNRTHSPRAAATVSSLLFALLHLANTRKLGTSSQLTPADLALQIAWAILVGAFLAMQILATGSLAESVLLHIINNLFAASMGKAVEQQEDGDTATTRTLIGM
jgi:membrane protease YdiL (CAAX protease family)